MLVNAPLVDQLAEPAADGQKDENASANCVPAALSSGVRALLPALSASQVDGDSLKDAAYGQGYTGATDPAKYGPYLKSQYGITLAEVSQSSGAALVATVRAALAKHQPVTGAIPSLWGNSFAGVNMATYSASTHEVLWCDDDGATLTAMNPWPVNGTSAFYQKQPYAWWAERIVYARVFVMEGPVVAVNDQNLGGGFKAYADAHSLSMPQVDAVGEHFNQPASGQSWAAWVDGPVLTYDSANGVSDQHGGRVVKLLLDQRDAALAALNSAQALLLSAQQAAKSAQAALAAAQSQAQSQISALQAQVAALQAQLAAAQGASAAQQAEHAAIAALAAALKGLAAA